MSAIDRLACSLGRRDEVPNQELARDLAAKKDQDGVAEIASHLNDRDRNVRSDCLKVIYEIGYIDPELIAPYASDLLHLLKDRNNRMVWGAMIGLSTVAHLCPDILWKEVRTIMDTVAKGTVITKVSGIRTLSRVAASDREYAELLFPFLLGELEGCIPRDVPTHAESMLPAVNEDNVDDLREMVEARMSEMTPAQAARARKVLRTLDRVAG